MRIELTIKTDYLPSWGVWEGVRELIQNAKDAETEHSAMMNVRHRKDTNTLVIENEGTTLPHEALLMGHTSKAGRTDTIGHFGEGLKLGVLALVRFGLPVKIRSGSEVWVPFIDKSEKFNADVLVFDVQKGRKDDNRVQVEVGGIDSETWEKISSRFLFLTKLRDNLFVSVTSGKLLTDPKFSGKLYVKGIFVGERPELLFGYDLAEAEVDRDRKMVNPYDLRWRTNNIWTEVVSRRPDMVKEYASLLESDAPDVQGMESDYAAGRLVGEVRQKLAKDFLARHGQNALPVGSLAESADIEHLGMNGVVVSKSLKIVLESELGTLEKNQQKLREQTKKKYGWGELNEAEKRHLQSALSLVNPVESIALDVVDVCDFQDTRYKGFYRDGRVLLAHEILSDAAKTLEVLVHEVAHKAGGSDGEKSHVANIERIWSGIVARLRGAS
jgi:hypothetical protein